MHDLTEGDVVTGLAEIAYASGVSMCAVVGEVSEGRGLTVVRKDGSRESYGDYVEDELLRVWREVRD
ncbi:MAG: hypothetical protein DRJ56_01300 [Thermoprotei archaeon]|nr:MAG: hypothetical protein DRJ56_01300 [Thermoprotei archaeon]